VVALLLVELFDAVALFAADALRLALSCAVAFLEAVELSEAALLLALSSLLDRLLFIDWFKVPFKVELLFLLLVSSVLVVVSSVVFAPRR